MMSGSAPTQASPLVGSVAKLNAESPVFVPMGSPVLPPMDLASMPPPVYEEAFDGGLGYSFMDMPHGGGGGGGGVFANIGPMNPNIVDQLRRQLEFYFSDANLHKDKFLRKEIAKSEDGWVALRTLASFHKVQSLTVDIAAVVAAARQCDGLEVDGAGVFVRRTVPLPSRNAKAEARRTIYIWNCEPESTIESIRALFAQFGPVAHVKLLDESHPCYTCYTPVVKSKADTSSEWRSPKTGPLAVPKSVADVIDDLPSLDTLLEENEAKKQRHVAERRASKDLLSVANSVGDSSVAVTTASADAEAVVGADGLLTPVKKKPVVAVEKQAFVEFKTVAAVKKCFADIKADTTLLGQVRIMTQPKYMNRFKKQEEGALPEGSPKSGPEDSEGRGRGTSKLFKRDVMNWRRDADPEEASKQFKQMKKKEVELEAAAATAAATTERPVIFKSLKFNQQPLKFTAGRPKKPNSILKVRMAKGPDGSKGFAIERKPQH